MYAQSGGGGFSSFMRTLLGTPTTPGMKLMATLMAFAVLLMIGPTFFMYVQAALEPWLIKQYGADYYVPPNIALWVIILPLAFFFLQQSLTSSAGMLLMYATKFAI